MRPLRNNNLRTTNIPTTNRNQAKADLQSNADQLLSLSLGHPDSLAWCGPGASSLPALLRTATINTLYHYVIKPR